MNDINQSPKKKKRVEPIQWTEAMKSQLKKYLREEPDTDSKEFDIDKASQEDINQWVWRYEKLAKNRYQDLLARYRKEMGRVENLEKQKEAPDVVGYFDSLRSSIHDQLKALGRALGKSDTTVNLDILAEGGNLQEFGLPEFQLIRIPEEKKGDLKFTGESPLPAEQVSAIIPFAAESSWHLYDTKIFFEKSPLDKEKRRRLNRTAADLGLPTVEMDLPETFHRGFRFIGIPVSGDDVQRISSYLRQHQKECSINEKDMDPEQIKKDWQETIQEMCTDIDTYIKEGRPGIGEDHEYLINTWIERLDRVLNDQKLLNFTKQEVEKIMQDIIDQKEKEKISERIDSTAHRDDQYEKFPKNEGMGRRT